MIEKGLDIPGGLNSDAEYIVLEPNDLSITFTKLNEIISDEITKKIKIHEEIPRLKSAEIISIEKSEIQEKEGVVEEKPLGWKEVMSAIKERNYLSAEELFKKMLEEEKFREEDIKTIAKILYYRALYFSGKSEAFHHLKGIADGNLEDDFAVQSLADCLIFYDKYKDAKEMMEAYLAKVSNNDIKRRLSIRLSAINIKLKQFEKAKENLYPFFANVPPNSNEYNFDIYKALGDVYKEEGELDNSCSLYEMALYYQPTDSDLRFRLAYDYAEVKKHSLSAYHYKIYLKSFEDSMVMNNLGGEYEELSLQGKAVTSYKKAVERDNTLASANLARLYIGKGFFDEAKLILNQAMEKEGHHENVEFYLNHLNTRGEEEEKGEESLLKDAKEHRENILEFAQAISVRFDKYEEIKGLWRTDYRDIEEFKIEFLSPNLLVGEHEIEEARKFAIPPPLFLKGESEKEIKRITFSGTIINRGLKFSLKVSRHSQKAMTTILGALAQSSFESAGFGILSPDGKEIRFVIEKERKIEVFTAKKVSLDQGS